MTLPDDSFIETQQRHAIRKHVEKALKAADAIGRYPTPVSDVMEAARISVSEEQVLDERFLKWARRKAKSGLKKALSKIIGLFDVVTRLVYIDHTIIKVKQTFLKLHETAHAVLPWQCDIYSAIEDCEKTLDPDISEVFDREANVFASDVLFQLDDFTKRVADLPLSIKVPLKYSSKYGASVYATIRRYVSTNHRACSYCD
jgi:Zn-dependent peptidase ImmA (M78 family)